MSLHGEGLCHHKHTAGAIRASLHGKSSCRLCNRALYTSTRSCHAGPALCQVCAQRPGVAEHSGPESSSSQGPRNAAGEHAAANGHERASSSNAAGAANGKAASRRAADFDWHDSAAPASPGVPINSDAIFDEPFTFTDSSEEQQEFDAHHLPPEDTSEPPPTFESTEDMLLQTRKPAQTVQNRAVRKRGSNAPPPPRPPRTQQAPAVPSSTETGNAPARHADTHAPAWPSHDEAAASGGGNGAAQLSSDTDAAAALSDDVDGSAWQAEALRRQQAAPDATDQSGDVSDSSGPVAESDPARKRKKRAKKQQGRYSSQLALDGERLKERYTIAKQQEEAEELFNTSDSGLRDIVMPLGRQFRAEQAERRARREAQSDDPLFDSDTESSEDDDDISSAWSASPARASTESAEDAWLQQVEGAVDDSAYAAEAAAPARARVDTAASSVAQQAAPDTAIIGDAATPGPADMERFDDVDDVDSHDVQWDGPAVLPSSRQPVTRQVPSTQDQDDEPQQPVVKLPPFAPRGPQMPYMDSFRDRYHNIVQRWLSFAEHVRSKKPVQLNGWLRELNRVNPDGVMAHLPQVRWALLVALRVQHDAEVFRHCTFADALGTGLVAHPRLLVRLQQDPKFASGMVRLFDEVVKDPKTWDANRHIAQAATAQRKLQFYSEEFWRELERRGGATGALFEHKRVAREVATLVHCAGMLHRDGAAPPPSADLWASMLAAIEVTASAMDEQEVTNTFQGCAHLRQPPTLVGQTELLAALVGNEKPIRPQHVAHCLWAIGDLGVEIDEPTEQKLLTQLVQTVDSMLPSEIAASFVALAKMRIMPDARLAYVLYDAACEAVPRMTGRCVANILWAHACTTKKIPRTPLRDGVLGQAGLGEGGGEDVTRAYLTLTRLQVLFQADWPRAGLMIVAM